jgi:two-component system, NtrC family, sensor kinase
LDEKTNKLLPDPVKYLLEIENKIHKDTPDIHPVLMTKNNQKLLISGKISPIMVGQKIHAGYVIVFDDVTQKEMAAAQSILSLKMESIGQLAAGIAHEINTPIQYVGDNLNFINRSFETLKEMDERQSEVIKTCRATKKTSGVQDLRNLKGIDHLYSEIPQAIQESLEGVERVRKIVQAIREFSHPSQKVNTFSDINKGILTTITLSKNEWKYCADLITELDPKMPLVCCRIDELNQVLLNMIVNAVHAIQQRQKDLNIEKGEITIRTDHNEDKVFIAVTDTGCGIPDNLVDRIFDPFFTTKDVGKGTGQGLSLAHNIIVNHHHGLISVNSKINVGTTFTIELPIGQQETG